MTRSAPTIAAAFLAMTVAGQALAQAPAQAPALAPAPAAPAQAQAPAKPANPDEVVATVNGTPIRAREVAIAEEDIGGGLPPLQGAQRADYILSFLTDMTLLAKQAETDKLDQTPEFKQRADYARTKALMEAIMTAEAKKAVTPEAMQKTYDEFVKSQPPEEEIRASHILVDDEAKAKEIAAKAKAGEDFAKLAKELSKDSAEDGGDLGYFTTDQMVPEFAAAAFKLEKGQVSDPVKTQFGWHVIKVVDKRKRPIPAFDDVKDQVKQYLERKAQADLVTRLRTAAKIEKAGAPAAPAQPAAPAAPATPAKP